SMVLRRSTGILNAVSGDVASFRDLAELTVEQFSPRVPVRGTPRSGPMPHDGYRPFDPSGIREAFPEYRMTSWQEGIAAVCKLQPKGMAP
ncbi:MAG TPA: hypothetical protein VII09_09700, partial [Opitutaceae bacterium]